MAVELMRVVWCDQCLGTLKKKVTAKEAVATLVDGKKFVQFDGCEKHNDPRQSDIMMYGYYVDSLPKPKKEPKAEKPTLAVVRGSKRHSVKCSICDRVVTSGPGFTLHAAKHERDGDGMAIAEDV